MRTFRAQLRPRSAAQTPWRADTLFGHLCWLILFNKGDQTLKKFIEQYAAGSPPIILSDGFPGDWLPRPMLPSPPPVRLDSKYANIEATKSARQTRQISWVHTDDFDALRRGATVTLRQPPKLTHHTELKNQINRLTGGTTATGDDEGGRLYSIQQSFYVDAEHGTPLPITVYIRVEEGWDKEAKQLLHQLGRSGYGARASTGAGIFDVEAFEACEWLDAPLAGANAFISLASWVPAAGDPTQGWYRTFVKHGRLGAGRAGLNATSPFKIPLLMLQTGSVLLTGEQPRQWYGRLIHNIAPGDDRIVQYGYSFAVPAVVRAEHDQ